MHASLCKTDCACVRMSMLTSTNICVNEANAHECMHVHVSKRQHYLGFNQLQHSHDRGFPLAWRQIRLFVRRRILSILGSCFESTGLRHWVCLASRCGRHPNFLQNLYGKLGERPDFGACVHRYATVNCLRPIQTSGRTWYARKTRDD
jgi:hypothetical protein